MEQSPSRQVLKAHSSLSRAEPFHVRAHTYVSRYFCTYAFRLVLLNFTRISIVAQSRLISSSNETSIPCLLASLNFILCTFCRRITKHIYFQV